VYWQLSGRDDVRLFLEKLIRYSTEISQGVRPDGEVVGAGWWSHLHSTMDMAAGIAEFGRLTGRGELVAWAARVYDWVGRTHTTRYGWVADVANSPICESCAIASRIRLGLALHRAGAADPFGEIHRHVRNQLLENQFVNLDFLAPLEPGKARTAKTTYAGIDCMIRGTFQCWGTANDLIGHDDIEGCGAGGGVQGLSLAWQAQSEWRTIPEGNELRVHLLFNRRIRAPASSSLTAGTPLALELWSDLPYAGHVRMTAHQPLARLALRLPDGTGEPVEWARIEQRRGGAARTRTWAQPAREGPYVMLPRLESGDRVALRFPLREYETVETANKVNYRVGWRGSSVTALEPRGTNVALYAHRTQLLQHPAPRSAPRYP
jgi:hypothetical protein